MCGSKALKTRMARSPLLAAKPLNPYGMKLAADFRRTPLAHALKQ